MGGIAGWITFGSPREDGALAVHTGRMIRALAHRGGGKRAVWNDDYAGLAHAAEEAVFSTVRAGHPYTVVCDASLTDAAPLRRSLARDGYAFEGESAAELILAAYLRGGEDCLHELNGSFAFLLWDGGHRIAFAARDAFGTRPLFYAPVDGGLLLASEMKGLFAHPQCVPELDVDGLREVLGIGPGRTPGNGVFRGVHELEPGECLRIDGDGIRPRTWYALEAREHADSLEETVEQVRALLFASIRRWWPEQSDACSLLSGGVDSSILTAATSNLSKETAHARIATYSFDYVDNAAHFRATSFQPESDAPYVEKVRAHCGTVHKVLLCDTENLVDALLPAMRARDLPGMADVDASLLYFCGQLAKSQRIAFSGECADEVFGGYPWFHRKEFFAADTFPWNTDPTARLRALNPELAEAMDIPGYVQQRYEAMLAKTPRLPGEPRQEARRREISYLNLYGFMQTLIERGDRMAGASGLELRTPYCDPALIQYLYNVPWEFKTIGNEVKGLLRATAEGLLPYEVLHRRKSPFPKTHNPAYERMVQERVRALLSDGDAPVRALLDVPAVLALCGEQADYGKPWFGQLMAGPQLLAWILQLDGWLKEYRLAV